MSFLELLTKEVIHKNPSTVLQTFFYRRNDVILTVHVFSPLNTLHKKMLSDRKLCLLLFIATIFWEAQWSTVKFSIIFLKFYITEHLADKML